MQGMILLDFRNYMETSLGMPFGLTLPYRLKTHPIRRSLLSGEGGREGAPKGGPKLHLLVLTMFPREVPKAREDPSLPQMFSSAHLCLFHAAIAVLPLLPPLQRVI